MQGRQNAPFNIRISPIKINDMSDQKHLQTLRVSFTLIQGFRAKVETDAVTVKIDTRPQTEPAGPKDARLYEAVFAAVKGRITAAKYKLTILNWHPVASAVVLDSDEYQQVVKK